MPLSEPSSPAMLRAQSEPSSSRPLCAGPGIMEAELPKMEAISWVTSVPLSRYQEQATIEEGATAG